MDKIVIFKSKKKIYLAVGISILAIAVGFLLFSTANRSDFSLI